jgi:ABC-type Na+ efflux pump permease subunit
VSKLKTIVVREYLATVRTRAFLIALLLMPLLVLASGAIPALAERHADQAERTCVVVDRSGGRLSEALVEASASRDAADASGGRFRLSAVSPSELAMAPDTLRKRLAARIRSNQLSAFIEIDAHITHTGQSEAAARYYSNTPTYSKLQQWLQAELQRAVNRERMIQAHLDVEEVERAEEPVLLAAAQLAGLGDGQGPAGNSDPIEDVGFPLVVAVLVFMAVLTSASPLVQGVLEEKMYRIAEILVSSVPPFQLLLGKLLAAALVAYTLVLLYVSCGLVIAAQVGMAGYLDLAVLGWGLLFLAIALLMYGSLFLAVGAACSDLKSTQSLMMPTVSLAMAPMLLLPLVLADPNGTTATVVSLIPFFTPILMLLRVTIAPGAPAWQVLLGVLLSGGTALLCVAAAAKVFRVGMLAQGSTPRLSELWRWAREG